MNTAGVIRRVQQLFGDSGETFLYTTDIVDWINDAQLEIARETQYKVDQDATNQASSFITGVAIDDVLLYKTVFYGSTPLALIDNETIHRMQAYEDTTQPRAYYIVADKIYLFPTPTASDDTVVTVTYVAAPVDLADENSTLDIPIKYHNDVVTYCVARSHERNENWRAAEIYDQRFRAGIAQRKYESLTADDSFRTIGPDIMDNEPLHEYNWET